MKKILQILSVLSHELKCGCNAMEGAKIFSPCACEVGAGVDNENPDIGIFR